MLGKRNREQSGNLISESDLELQLLETPTRRKVQTPVLTKVNLRNAGEGLSPAFARALEFGSCSKENHDAPVCFVEPVSPQPLLLRSKSMVLGKSRLRFSEDVPYRAAQPDNLFE